MSTTFKFVTSYESPRQKRLQSQRACEGCRKRKKRCNHTDVAPQSSVVAATTDTSGTGTNDPQGNLKDTPHWRKRRAREDQQKSHTTSKTVDIESQDITPIRITRERAEFQAESNATLQNQEGRASRFIGDLNPEGIFLAATSPDAIRGDSHDSIGVWLRRTSQPSSISLQSPSSLFYRSSSLVQNLLVPMLEEECRSTIPPPAQVEALSKIYFEKVHPIFPVIDEKAYRDLNVKDPAHILLQQGICLAASKNFTARPHLTMASSPPLDCREFGERLFGAMRISVEMGLISDNIVLIQGLTLMSQFSDHPISEDISSQLCGKAVHHVQSLGLHLKGQREAQRDQRSTTLLCCVWAVDRMSAAFSGRPVLMHERDLSQNLELCFEQQVPCFRLFLHIISLLDKIIDLYRPHPNSGDPPGFTLDFPAFEDVVLRCGASRVGTSALATIETLYHAVAILSCRSKTWAEPERSSTPYLRQSMSTSVLSSTIIKELYDELTVFPFIPYAISLSMSTSYREMRHSKLPLHRTRARAQFQTLCDALSELKGIFWSASTTSEMGKKLLKEIDRVSSTVSWSETRRPHIFAGNGTAATACDPTPISRLSRQNSFADLPTTANEQIQNQITQDFDSSLVNSIADIDLFGMFDPAFDLDSFDACLEGNLNLAFPNPFP